MPAPSLDYLLDFETNWDAAIAMVFSALPYPVNPAHGSAELVAPYVTAVFSFLGEASGAPGATQPLERNGGGNVFDGVTFRGRIRFEVVVDRTKAKTTQLTAARGGIRRLMLPSSSAFSADTLPYYSIYWLEMADPGPREIDVMRDQDITPLVWDLRFAVRPAAWPTP